MNNELLQTLERRISQTVEEINVLRQNVAQLESQNQQLLQEKNELERVIEANKEQQSNWEQSMSNMLDSLNNLDDAHD